MRQNKVQMTFHPLLKKDALDTLVYNKMNPEQVMKQLYYTPGGCITLTDEIGVTWIYILRHSYQYKLLAKIKYMYNFQEIYSHNYLHLGTF
jgi:hypothetical protein